MIRLAQQILEGRVTAQAIGGKERDARHRDLVGAAVVQFRQALGRGQAEIELERILIGEVERADIMPALRQMDRQLRRDEAGADAALGRMTEDQRHQ